MDNAELRARIRELEDELAELTQSRNGPITRSTNLRGRLKGKTAANGRRCRVIVEPMLEVDLEVALVDLVTDHHRVTLDERQDSRD